MDTVAMPASSIMPWTKPTAWLHIGHTGHPHTVDYIQQRQGFGSLKHPPAAAIEHNSEHKFKANVRKRTTDSEWDIGVEGANPK